MEREQKPRTEEKRDAAKEEEREAEIIKKNESIMTEKEGR